MMAAIRAVASNLVGASADAEQFFNFAKVAQVRGVTTIVDGGGSTYFEPAFLQAALAATGSPDFPGCASSLTTMASLSPRSRT